MKVTVTKYLNVRVGKPSVNAPCYQYLAPGRELEVDGKLYDGDTYEGIATWMKDEAGNYYWSGGIAAKNTSQGLEPREPISLPQESYNYNALFNLPQEWKKSYGKNVKVALIDTGLFVDHPDFLSRVSSIVAVDCSRVLAGEPYQQDDSSDGHGSHCAGLIAAYQGRLRGVTGLAPQADLMMIKGYVNGLGYEETRVAYCLKYATDNGAEIISMSFNINYPENEQLIQQIKRANENNVLLVGAAGDDTDLTSNSLYYPAMFDNCVKVGSIADDCLRENINSLNSSIDFLLRRVEFVSTSTKENGYYKSLNGCSMATAIVSGIAALCVSVLKGNAKPRSVPIRTIVDSLIKNASSIPTSGIMNSYTVYKQK